MSVLLRFGLMASLAFLPQYATAGTPAPETPPVDAKDINTQTPEPAPSPDLPVPNGASHGLSQTLLGSRYRPSISADTLN
jgi:hypothetical protein